ncbi:MAG: PAS domain S-box protein, partial [Coleofasciculaceae cyanobacterium SM2_3_26]|nr:PAS domain S-box protein [Coleofasciculaceae cyanobacterium SM2_3_26]
IGAATPGYGAALRTSEQRYRSVVDNLTEVIFQTNAEGIWTFLNPAWEEITGFSVAESLGTCFLDYVHLDDRQVNLEKFQPLIERKKDFCRHQVRYLTKDGGFRWIEVFARLTLGDRGEILGTSGTLNDVTEVRQSEAWIRSLYELTSTRESSFTQRLERLLQLGCQWFGTDVGMLSQADEVGRYAIQAIHCRIGTCKSLMPGDVLEGDRSCASTSGYADCTALRGWWSKCQKPTPIRRSQRIWAPL